MVLSINYLVNNCRSSVPAAVWWGQTSMAQAETLAQGVVIGTDYHADAASRSPKSMGLQGTTSE
jgi:hypothetical protein